MHGKVFSLIGLLVLSSITFAQVAAPIITTFAGGGPNGIPAVVSNLKKPGWVAVDSFGNLFISDNNLNRVFEVTTDGILRTVVRTVYEDPNGMAFAPLGLTADDQGNLYIGSDYYIYKYDPETKALSVYAGDGTWSYKGENVPALSTGMFPQSVYWKNGNLYYCDLGTQRLRYIDSAGYVRTIAGNGTAAFGGENVVANSSPINGCLGVATNGNGRVYFSEDHRIRVVDVEGVLYTYAGDGSAGYSGDGGPAILARLFQPMGLWVDAGDNLFITDSGNHSIRVVYGADQKIATYAGRGALGFAGDGGLATQADMAYPNDMTGDSAGNVYIADSNNNRIREVFKVSGVINTIAGSGEETIAGDGYPATSATLSVPYVAAVLPNGGTLISDTYNSRLRIVDVYGGISTFAGTTYGFGGDNGPAFSAQMKAPVGTAVGPDGSIYVADVEDHRIRKIDPNGTITTFAGTGVAGSNGDNGLAKDAQLNSPAGLAFDAQGSLYVSEADGDRIRVISPGGYIFTVAGTGIAGFNGDGIPPTSAQLSNPAGIFYDNTNNVLYVADADNGRVRAIDFGLNVITTIAGNPNGIDADNIPATSAILVWPSMISFDAAGRMYITDMDGNKVRVVTPVVGAPSMISTIAGTGLPGVIGDGGPASSALLNTPTAAVIDRQGNLLIADSANDRIRKVILTSAETTPPLLDVFQNPVPTGNEWYNVPLQFTLYASDAGSGVKEVYYELTGAQTETNHIPGSIGTFVISTAGLTNIHAYAVDNDNNVSVGYQKMVGLDFTAPRPPTVDVNPLPDANGWNYTPVTVTFTPAGDPGSPASGVSSCTNPVNVTQETTGIVVSGTCQDAAGNVSSATSVTVKINLSGLQADLALLAESEPEVVNGKVRYGVTITNNGPSDAHNVQVTDLLTRFTATNVGAGSGTCSNLGSSVTCTWPTMPNNGSDYVWIEVTPPNSGWAMHEFVSSATEADPNRNNNTAFVNGEIVNNTRTGTNIAVVADATSSTSVVFDNVTRAGLTTIKAVPGQAPPAGYRQGSAPLIFDAGTTAGFTGLVTVTLNLRGVVFRHPATVRLFKWEAGVWCDITAGLNLSVGVISGRTGSLTRFGVFEMNDRAPEAAAVDRVIPSQSSTGMAVTLDGTHSADADGDTLTYKWTGAFPEGNGTVTGPTPTVTLPMGASPITLIVNDGEVDSAPMATTVIVSSFRITALLASASVQKGQAAPFEIQVSPQYGAFNAPVTLACPNLPASMTCRFSEASVTPGSSGSKVVLTISTAQSASLRSRYIYAFAFLLPASFLLVADSTRRRWMVLSVLVVALLAFLVACGSSGYVSINNGQLTAQVTVQSVTVTGTSGGLASSTGLSVTIKP